MWLESLACVRPEPFYTQAECWELLRNSSRFAELRPGSQRLLERILKGSGGIDRRHFAMPQVERLFDLSAEELNRGFEREAPRLGGEALGRALEEAGLRAGELDALLVCTCTGYLCPGLSSYIAEAAGLRPDAYLGDLVGLGCGAALPLLRQAAGLLALDPDAKVACVSVEVCSAAFYIDDDPGVLVSLCLFGDGAAASIWSGDRAGEDAGKVRAYGFDTLHRPEAREQLRFENRGGKLRNRLERTVPATAAAAVRELHARSGANGAEVITHAGGRDVLDAVADSLQVPDLPTSREVLRDGGNMSSPSVLFAVDEVLRARAGRPIDLWASSFGAGFSCHSCRLTGGNS